MSALRLSAASRKGDTVIELELPQVSRGTLALYAGASGDHVPLHIDSDVARRAGMPDVFAQGMLVAAWLGRMLTNAVGVSRVREMSLRFTGITHLYNRITCRATLLELVEVDGEPRARLQVLAENQYGQPKVVGEAVVALP
jgi:acyl dehydratase